MERLRIVEEGQERFLDITGRVVTIGRSSKNDITVKDRNTSRRHCNIIQVGDGWYAVDCDSHNGTFVNGVRITKKELAEGDKISIGAVDIIFLKVKEGEKPPAVLPEKSGLAESVGKNQPPIAPLPKIEEAQEKIEFLEKPKKEFPEPEEPEKQEEIEVEEIEEKFADALRPEDTATPPHGIAARRETAAEKKEAEEPLAGFAKESEKEVAPAQGEGLLKELRQLKEFYQKFQTHMAFHLIGQEKVGKLLLTALISGGHCVIQGENLGAKIVLLTRMAKILDLSFRHLCWNPSYPAEVLRRSNLLFLQNIPHDLILSYLWESTFAKPVAIPGEHHYHKLPEPYLLVLPEDVLEQQSVSKTFHNSFLFAIPLAPLSLEQELSLLEMSLPKAEAEKAIVSPQEIQSFQRACESVKVSRGHLEYVTRLIRATRPAEEDSPNFVKEKVAQGVNPTVGVWVVKAARATAALHGRDSVSSKDIQGIGRYLIPGRLELTPTALKMEESSEAIYNALVSKIKEPVE